MGFTAPERMLTIFLDHVLAEPAPPPGDAETRARAVRDLRTVSQVFQNHSAREILYALARLSSRCKALDATRARAQE